MRVAIVEDEEGQRERLRNLIACEAEARHLELPCTAFPDGASFLSAEEAFDVVFLDIVMPGEDGLTVAHRLRARDEQVMIVFITSMAQYAVRGYEVNALDFLVKPFEYEAFTAKMDRVCRMYERRKPAVLTITEKGRTLLLPIRELAYVEVYDHELLFHLRDKVISAHGKLSQLEEDARFSGFIRCSQSHLVNCAFVEEVNAETLTVRGEKVPFSRRRRKGCLQRMAEILGGGFA